MLSQFVVEPTDDDVGRDLDRFRAKRAPETKAGSEQRIIRRASLARPTIEPVTPEGRPTVVNLSTAIWIVIVGLVAVAVEVAGILFAAGHISH